jgi:hypothetical protein
MLMYLSPELSTSSLIDSKGSTLPDLQPDRLLILNTTYPILRHVIEHTILELVAIAADNVTIESGGAQTDRSTSGLGSELDNTILLRLRHVIEDISLGIGEQIVSALSSTVVIVGNLELLSHQSVVTNDLEDNILA